MSLSRHRARADGQESSPVIWDLLALLFVLGLAWFNQWEARDLIWSLWLSSLVVGYATIVISIYGSVSGRAAPDGPMRAAGYLPVWMRLAGGLFMLAFFTVHFGAFHFVHSVFLNMFFPVGATVSGRPEPAAATYWLVLTSYWPFVLATAVAERGQLWRASRKMDMAQPYKNVIRMHLLLFFFAGAAALKFDSFLIYTVVLLVYFFPARLLRGRRAEAPPGALRVSGGASHP